MDIKYVYAALIFGTVFANHDLVKGSWNNCNIKEYLGEVFGNMSNRFCNGTNLATKEDIVEMKREFVADVSTNCLENQKIIRLEKEIAELKNILKPKPIDCDDILIKGYQTTGIYTVFLRSKTSAVSVRCDMDTSYGGWTVIQRRVSDSNFYKPWSEYEAGFGNLRSNFWLGLRNIHLITKQAKYELRVDLSSMNGETAYAYYDEFSVGAAESDYKLNVGAYSGTAGDSLIRHNGMKFSTYDQDNDIDSGNCAVKYHGAWWYYRCHSSNLNGDYGNKDYAEGPVWEPWKGYYSPLKTTEMKIRRVD